MQIRQRSWARAVVAALVAAAAVWCVATRIAQTDRRDWQPAWVAPLLPWDTGFAPVTPDRPLAIDLPRDAKAVRFRVLGTGGGGVNLAGAIASLPLEIPLLRFETKRDGERSWYAANDLSIGAVLPPNPEPPARRWAPFEFELEFSPSTAQRRLTGRELGSPGRLAITLPLSAAGERLMFRAERYLDEADPAGPSDNPPLTLDRVFVETAGGVRVYPQPAPWWMPLLALAAGIGGWLLHRRYGGRVTLGAAAALFFGYLGLAGAAVTAAALAAVWGWRAASPLKEESATHGAAWVAWVAAMLLLAAWWAVFSGPEIWDGARYRLLAGIGLLWPTVFWLRRRAIPAFGAAVWLFALLAVFSLVEQRAAQANALARGRNAGPNLDTWNLATDTDLGTRRAPTLAIGDGPTVGWLGSSSTYGSGLVSRRLAFPEVFADLWNEAALAERRPEPLAGNIVWARPGYGLLQLYLYFTAPHAREPVDVLVVYFGGNAGIGVGAADFYQNARTRLLPLAADDSLRDAALATGWSNPLSLRTYELLRHHSEVFGALVHRRFLRERRHAFRAEAGDGLPMTTPSHAAVLAGLAEYCAREGTRLALVAELNREGSNINPAFADLMREAAAEHEHVHFFDLGTPLGDGAAVGEWFVDFVHPNAKGHRIIAERLVAAITPLVAGHETRRQTKPTAPPTLDELVER